MKKFLAALGAIVLISGCGAAGEYQANIGYSTSSYAAQTSMGAFNTSVRDRLSMIRIGDLFLTGFTSSGRRVAALASETAYGAAPSVRAANSPAAYGYNGETRRQLECVYTSGFSLWGDVYGAWERQKSYGGAVGYKYRVGGPALGFDWTTGGLTLGIAATYNWGTIRNVGGNLDYNKNTRDTRTWALMAYGQYNARRWYANGSLGYGETRFKSSVRAGLLGFDLAAGDRYRDKSWNMDAEFGMKFRFGGGFLVTPNIGLSYFRDRRSGFTSDVTGRTSGDNHHSLELPVGVNLAYEFAAGGALIVPQLRFAWVPELARTDGSASGVGGVIDYSDHAARRSRNAFELGLGVQAKLNQTVSLHLDYDVTLRGRYYNHNLNLGVGVTF